MRNSFKESSKDRSVAYRNHNSNHNTQKEGEGEGEGEALAKPTHSSINPNSASSSTGYHPIAYPYQLQQADEKDSEADWELTVGNSENMGGIQKVGNIKIGNCFSSPATNSPVILPRKERFVLKIGNHSNQGGQQEVSDVELGNIRA